MKFVLIVLLLFPLSASPDEILTEEEEIAYIYLLELPQIAAIREYLNKCLSGADGMDYPCEPDKDYTYPGQSIRELPREYVEGRFMLLSHELVDRGGEVWGIMFDQSPYLVAHVWMYPLDDVPVIRSFYTFMIPELERQEIAQTHASVLKDRRLTR